LIKIKWAFLLPKRINVLISYIVTHII